MQHEQQYPEQSIDTTRRRLAKAGLAAPAVLGVLASRPVLGGPLHHCTPSGYISGFASPHPGATPCSSIGHPPSFYIGNTEVFTRFRRLFLVGANPLPFKDTPNINQYFHGNLVRFADAYQVRNTLDNSTQDATVWDVLAGCRVNNSTWACMSGWVLEAKAGFNPDITLGQEAVTALLNAYNLGAAYPILAQQVVEMFNIVVSGGLYQVTSTNQWNAAEVKAYWQSLHA